MNGIHAITPFTLLDYPGEIACIVWFPKCNLRCVYCHNPDIVHGQAEIDDVSFTTFLEQRRGKLTGVVLSGGEPTFCSNLLSYAAKAKELGFKVKLDTNGTNPEMVAEVIRHSLVDYIALDFKCPPSRAKELIGTDRFSAAFATTLAEVIAAHRDGKIALEVRTTYHADFMDEDELNQIIAALDALDYRGIYYIQNIVSTGDKTLGNIEKPRRKFDTEKLVPSRKFEIKFRNFA